jgi:thioredoxin reductase
MRTRAHDVAVIGAGPYGLATGAHLRSRGLDVVVLGRTMSSWREAMPAGMVLRSERASSNISSPDPSTRLANYLTQYTELESIPLLLPIGNFIEYGTWFERTQLADVRRDEMVRCLSRDDAGMFRLELESGEVLESRAVVVAAGHRMHARMPEALQHLAGESALVSHASEHPDLAVLQGRRVAIIGAGQSALETAALLNECGATPTLIVRGAAIEWDLPPKPSTRLYRLRRPHTGLGHGWPKRVLETHAEVVRPLPMQWRHHLLGAVLGPSGAFWLRDRVEPFVDTRLNTHVESAEIAGDQVLLRVATSNGEIERLEVDHVIAATGYRFELDRLDLLDRDLRSRIHTVGGYPHLSSHLESSVSDLYFTGLAAGGTFGPVMRFVCGTNFAAPRVTNLIVRHRRRQRTPV